MIGKLNAVVMRGIVVGLLLLLSLSTVSAKELFDQNEVMLWPNGAPGSEGLMITETVIERSKDPAIKNRALVKITDPSFIPLLADKDKATGVAVLIFPGGGYDHLTFDKEGYDIANWLNSIGVSAFIVKSRLPVDGHKNSYLVPLQDAQRAMRIIRKNAADWGVDPNKIGLMGFSAGGHLAAVLGTTYSKKVYEAVDDADNVSCKPNFMVLLYPAISTQRQVGLRTNLLGKNPSQELINEFSAELHVDSNTPTTLIIQADDDPQVTTLNSTDFYNALKNAKVSAELHIFKKGGHGFGIIDAKGPIASWTKICEEWLIGSAIISK
ncbi:MAG: alpha/beta hydrolase [Negativicutes bacterium]|nr:alpha/beta hydrolase [Negativicutes bacterium]